MLCIRNFISFEDAEFCWISENEGGVDQFRERLNLQTLYLNLSRNRKTLLELTSEPYPIALNLRSETGSSWIWILAEIDSSTREWIIL